MSNSAASEQLAAALHEILAASFRDDVHRLAHRIVDWLGDPDTDIAAETLCDRLAELASGDPSKLAAVQLCLAETVGETNHARLAEFFAELARAFDAHEPPSAADFSGVDASEVTHDRPFLQYLIDAIPDPIFVKDRHHRWILLNDAYCEFMGYSRDELLGKSDYDFFPTQEADVFWEKDDLVFETGTPHENEEMFTDAEGNQHVIVTKKQRFVDPRGRQVLVGVIRDVTERRRLESRLAVARRLMSLGTLAGGVSHEINNPLSFLSANLDYALDALDDPRESPDDIAEALRSAQRGARRVREIVGGLESISRSADENARPVDVRDKLRSTVDIARNEIEHRAQLVEQYGPVPLVDANDRSLGQIFLNLLTNAIQALESTAEQNQVAVETRTSPDGAAIVEISDTGIGIPDDVLEQIFDPFYTTKPVGEGTGLGLAICHSLVDAMRGHIEVDTEPGEGSTFRVVFPPSSEPAPLDDEPASTSPSATTEDPLDKPQILIIDDEPDFLDSIRRRLRRRFDIECARTVDEAMTLLSDPSTSFDLVLSDVMMPETSGRDLYELLAEQAPDYLNRLAFMSGGVFDAQLRRFIDEQDRPVLDKFFDADDLLELLSRT